MRVRVYQIDAARSTYNDVILYLGIAQLGNSAEEIDGKKYNKVFDGNVRCRTPMDVFAKFDQKPPHRYRGRGMALSDVIEIEKDGRSEFYFCGDVDFPKIDFDPSKAEDKTSKWAWTSTSKRNRQKKKKKEREKKMSGFVSKVLVKAADYIDMDNIEDRKGLYVDIVDCITDYEDGGSVSGYFPTTDYDDGVIVLGREEPEKVIAFAKDMENATREYAAYMVSQTSFAEKTCAEAIKAIKSDSMESWHLSIAFRLLDNIPVFESPVLYYDMGCFKNFPDDALVINEVTVHPEDYVVVDVLFK